MKNIVVSCSKRINREITYNCFKFATFKQYLSEGDFFKIQIGFKNLINQTKQVSSVIQIFNKYEDQKYKAIMYSYALRSLGRIIRRDFIKKQEKINLFLGQNYSKLKSLDISNLQAQNIIDIVSFILYHQNVGKTISHQTRQVVDMYLQKIVKLFKQNQHSIQHRGLSQILFAARCSQLFRSKYYSQFLNLLVRQIKFSNLNIFRLKTIFKFLLKIQHLTSIQQQVGLFDQIIKKLSDQKILQRIEMTNIRIIYGNLMSIMQNYIFVKSIKKHPFVDQIQNSFRKNLYKIQAIQIIRLCQTIMKFQKQNCQLFKFVFLSIIQEIRQDGQTSFNPVFVLEIISLLRLKQTKILPKNWNFRFLKMIKFYFFDTNCLVQKINVLPQKNNVLPQKNNVLPQKNNVLPQKNNVSKLQEIEFIQQCFNSIIAKRIIGLKQMQFLQKYFQNDECSIVPYNRNSFIKEKYHLQTMNWQKLYQDIVDLEQLYKLQYKFNLFEGVFNQLKQCIPQQIMNNQNLVSTNIINNRKQFYRKRFINILISLCKVFQKHSLVLQVIKIELQFAKRTNKNQLCFTLSNIIKRVQFQPSQQLQYIKLITSQYQQLYCHLITQEQSCYKGINSQSIFRVAVSILQADRNQRHLITFIKNKDTSKLFMKFNKKKFVFLIFKLLKKNKIELNDFQVLAWRTIQQFKTLYQQEQVILLIEKVLQVKLQNETFIKYLVNLIISNNFCTQKIINGLIKLQQFYISPQLQKYLLKANPTMFQKLFQNSKGFFSNKIFKNLPLIELKSIFLNLKFLLQKVPHQQLQNFQKLFLKKYLEQTHFQLLDDKNSGKIKGQNINSNQQYNLQENILILKNIFLLSPNSQIQKYVQQILSKMKKFINTSVIRAHDLFTILKILSQNKIFHQIVDQNFIRQLLTNFQFLNQQQVLKLISDYPVLKTKQILMECIPQVINNPNKNLLPFLRIYCLTIFAIQQANSQLRVNKLIQRLIKYSKVKVDQQILMFLSLILNTQTFNSDNMLSSISFNKVQNVITIEKIEGNKKEQNITNFDKNKQFFDVCAGKNIKSVSELIVQNYFRLRYKEDQLIVMAKQKKMEKALFKNKQANRKNVS